MHDTIDRDRLAGREVLHGAEAAASANHEPDAEFLMLTDDLLDIMRKVYGFKVTRRTIQLYSSPGLRLLPRPVHIGGHISYYAHPEHTERLAVILHLATREFMPLKAIKKLLRVYPPRHYRLLLKDVLTTRELADFQDFSGRGVEIKDLLFMKIGRILLALDEKFDPREHTAEGRETALFSMARQYEKWLNSEHRDHAESVVRFAELT